MLRILKNMSMTLLFCCALLAGLVACVVYTTPGLHLAITLVSGLSHGRLHVVGLEGQLASHIHMQELTLVYNPESKIIFKNVALQWSIKDLLQQQIHPTITWQKASMLVNNTAVQLDKGQFQADYFIKKDTLTSELRTRYGNKPLHINLTHVQSQWDGIATLGNDTVTLTKRPAAPWTALATLPDLQFLHPLFDIKSTLTAKATFTDDHTGALDITLGKGVLTAKKDMQLSFEKGSLHAVLDTHQLLTTATLTLDNNKQLEGSLLLPNFHYDNALDPTQKLVGNVQFTMQSLSFLNEIHPWVNHITGQLQGKLTLRGTVQTPLIKSEVVLRDAHVALPTLGISTSPIELSLQQTAKKWRLKASINANGNPVVLNGNGTFLPTIKGKMSLTGKEISLFNTKEYMVSLSPNLQLDIAPARIQLNGSILIPKASIKPLYVTDTKSLSDDVTFVDAAPTTTSPAPSKSPWNIKTNITIAMGEDVAFAIKGLTGYLTGQVALQQLPNKPATANGTIHITKGNYKAYGQDLVVDQGQLLFSGEYLDNPEIVVRAVKEITKQPNVLGPNNKTIAGIKVAGHLKTPKITLFSIPANLSEADILSLLLLGTRASQASDSGAALLLAAVSTLNLNSQAEGGELLSQLKQKLGLDFNIDNTQPGKVKTANAVPNFVIGKALSKKLYLSYNTSNNVTLKYLLNQFFSLQVSAGVNASGLDVLYTHSTH